MEKENKSIIDKFKKLPKTSKIIISIFIVVLVFICVYQFSNNKTNTSKSQDFSSNDVVIGKRFNNISDVNFSTGVVAGIAWSGYTDSFPNAKLDSFEITDSDGYGRYVVFLKYMKNTTDTHYSYENDIVYCTEDKQGKYLSTGDVDSQKEQVGWGTPITD